MIEKVTPENKKEIEAALCEAFVKHSDFNVVEMLSCVPVEVFVVARSVAEKEVDWYCPNHAKREALLLAGTAAFVSRYLINSQKLMINRADVQRSIAEHSGFSEEKDDEFHNMLFCLGGIAMQEPRVLRGELWG